MSVTSIELVRRVLRAVSAGAIFCGALLLSVAANHAAFGTPIPYPDYVGNTVKYVAISEQATTPGDGPALFGAPTGSADSLNFSPSGFSAHASGALGIDTTDGNLKFDVDALQGFVIKTLKLTEGGDTSLSSTFPGFGTDATKTIVTANVFLTISEVDGVANHVGAIPLALAFTPSGGIYRLATDGGGSGNFTTTFDGSLPIDLDQILRDNGVLTGSATKISIDLDNTLTAKSENHTQSLIAKKSFGGLSITVNSPLGGGGPNSPEPTSLVLACLGFAGLVAKRLFAR
jgi:hypothetical protein